MASLPALLSLSVLRTPHVSFKKPGASWSRRLSSLHGRKSAPIWASLGHSLAERRLRLRCFSQGEDVCCQHPFQQSVIGEVAKHAVPFPVKGEAVEVLSSPADFFNMLKRGIVDARERVVMSSLYMGIGHLEQELLNVIVDALNTKSSLQVLLLFDALRSTRTTLRSDQFSFSSSADMLSHVLLSSAEKWQRSGTASKSYGDRLRIALYRTPDLTRRLEKILPSRLNEAVGVCHMKAYIFDDVVLMSGANLSTSYFTNRQDRYMILRDCRNLADYLCSTIEMIASFSYILDGSGSLQRNSALVDPRCEPTRFRAEMAEAVEKLIDPSIHNPPPEATIPKIPHGELDSLQDRLWLGGRSSNTWVFPTVQMGPVGIQQDELCTLCLLESLPAGSTVNFASAYFNLTPEIEVALLEASLDKVVKLLTASPQANGFYGSPGILGFIPKAYSLLEQSLFERAQHVSREHLADPFSSSSGSKFQGMANTSLGGLQIFEYKRQNWTFHAKGMWCSLPGDGLLPSVTSIGSSNFGYRSRHRDLEFQLLLITAQPGLRRSLQEECNALFSHSKQVQRKVFSEPDRAGGPVTSFAAKMVRSWL
eukprot:c23927_g1_i1 orf=1491-3269(+)